MRLRVLSRRRSSDTETFVEGDTGLGVLSGLWRDSDPPIVGHDYDVELTVPDPEDLRVIPEPAVQRAGVESDGTDRLRFRGQCDHVYDDGVIIVRMARDWIDMVGAENFVCKEGDWVEYTIPRDQVEIYPCGW